MGVTYQQMRHAAAELYGAAPKKVPDNTLDAACRASGTETYEIARQTLQVMLHSPEREDKLVFSDLGVPVYVVQIGTAVRM